MLTSSLLRGGVSLDVGLPRAQQIEAPWREPKCQLTREAAAIGLLDCEITGATAYDYILNGRPAGPGYLANSRKAVVAARRAYKDWIQSEIAATRALIPGQRLAVYCGPDCPIRDGVSYDDRYLPFKRDARRLYLDGVFAGADLFAYSVYPHWDVRAMVTPAWAKTFTNRTMDAASVIDMPQLVTIGMHYFQGDRTPLPVDVVGAMVDAVIAAGHIACLYGDIYVDEASALTAANPFLP